VLAERPTKSPQQVHRARMRLLNRAVLAGCALFVPLYIGLRITGGSAERLELLPDLLSRIKTPIVWSVPDGGVRYLRFFHGEPSEGHRFVLVRVHMEARMNRWTMSWSLRSPVNARPNACCSSATRSETRAVEPGRANAVPTFKERSKMPLEETMLDCQERLERLRGYL